MKIVILLLSLVLGLGAAGKKTADDIKDIRTRTELNSLKKYPNLLPVVEVVAPRA